MKDLPVSPPQKEETTLSQRAIQFLHNDYRFKIPVVTGLVNVPASLANSAENNEVYYLSPLNMLFKMEEINDETGKGTGKFTLKLCANLIAAIPAV